VIHAETVQGIEVGFAPFDTLVYVNSLREFRDRVCRNALNKSVKDTMQDTVQAMMYVIGIIY